MRHAFRGSPFGEETFVDLGDEGIDMTDGTSRHVALGDIVRVRLRRIPLRASTDQFICELEPRNGNRLRICSASYHHLVAIENRAATWRPLVEQLHRQLMSQSSPPQFIAGDPPIRFALLISVWLVLVAVALWLLSEGAMLGLVALFPIAFVGIFYWYRRLHANRPRPYDPRALPPILMPALPKVPPA
ncbi:MAG: hypothetical protein JO055_16070 [Alphaproteobacteria bacterium]|nr:hypothetical protein [Alphaproteobacteria bacterium]